MAALSVIVTTYNVEDYVEACLEGVRAQTLDDIEIIVVDDGSTDGTVTIIEEMAQRDPRIVPILLADNTVGGVGTAANAGLDAATAPYVGFMDGDDLCEPEMFERLLSAARTHATDLAMCRYVLLDDETGDASAPADDHRWADLDSPAYVLDMAMQRTLLQFVAVPWRKIYRREVLQQHGIRFPVGDHFYEDNPFHWFSLLSANSVAVVHDVLCQHRVGRRGQTMNVADPRLLRIFDHHDTIRDWLDARDLTDDFAPSLVLWVVAQMEWVSAKTPPSGRRELFDRLGAILLAYDDETVGQALLLGKRGQRARALVAAVRADNVAGFVKTLDRPASGANPLVSAGYHLRYSGPIATARLTRKYVAEALERRGRGRGRSVARPAEDGVSHRDIMFALVLLDKRLRAIEQRLDGRPEHLPSAPSHVPSGSLLAEDARAGLL